MTLDELTKAIAGARERVTVQLDTSADMPTKDFLRLPKKAQAEIARLTHQRDAWRAHWKKGVEQYDSLLAVIDQLLPDARRMEWVITELICHGRIRHSDLPITDTSEAEIRPAIDRAIEGE